MSDNDAVRRQKQDIRKRIWSQMEQANVTRFPKPVYGRIPNFLGAEAAAQKLCGTDVFQKARAVFCCPDSP